MEIHNNVFLKVTNDTLLTSLYDMLTDPSRGAVSTWFSTLNTVISSVTQTEEYPKRLLRRYYPIAASH